MPGEYTFYAGSKLLEPLSDSLGVSVDKVNLVCCQFLSVPLAILYYKRCSACSSNPANRTVRLFIPTVIGLTMCYFCYGSAMKHIIANAAACYLLLRYSPTRYVHRLVFIASMGYLSFLHFYRWYILTSYCIDITGPMMLLVQKVTTLAFSLHDGKVKTRSELNAIQQKEAIPECPSVLEYTSFLFHFQAALTGPLCFFSDYIDFIDGRQHSPIDHKNETLAIDEKGDLVRDGSGGGAGGHRDMKVLKLPPAPWPAVAEKVVWSLIFLLISTLITPRYPPEIMISDPHVASMGFLSWWTMLYFVMLLQRIQYYCVWMLADAACNASGFGFNGYDVNGAARWDLISNVKVWQFEMAGNFRDSLDGWNCTTMYWLRRVAYDRTPRRVRTLCTYLLSAWWHGFFPGYYLTFLTAAVFTITARRVRRYVRPLFYGVDGKGSAVASTLYNAVAFLSTKFTMAYCSFPFVTLWFSPGWTLYRELHFCCHLASFALLLLLPFVFSGKSSGKPLQEAANGTKREAKAEKAE